MIKTPKGQTVPQTIENLQEIMAADAVTMEGLHQENQELRVRVNRLEQKLAKARREDM